jgi:nucleoid DNA-binding protein
MSSYMSEKYEYTPKYKVENFIEAFGKSVREVVTSGEEIRFTDFGMFKTRARPGRTVDTRYTNGPVEVKPSVWPIFIPCPEFKEEVTDACQK